jgi:site-specific DNA-adenine methylase
MKNHFIFSYSGNKRDEVDRLFDMMNLDDQPNIKYIVEPCCGTSAVSYYISTKRPNKYTYILNDLSDMLYTIYKTLMDKVLSDKLETEINNLVTIFNSFDNMKDRKLFWDPIRQKKSEKTFCEYVFTQKFGVLQGKMCPPFDRVKQIKPIAIDSFPIVKFLRSEKVILFNKPDIEIIKQYRDDEEYLLFLDPPYISTSNAEYSNCDMNVYGYLSSPKGNIENYKCKIYLILENIWIMKVLFNKALIRDTYKKIYQGSRKKTEHIILSN